MADGGSPFLSGQTGTYTLVTHNTGTATSSGTVSVSLATFGAIDAITAATGSGWECSLSSRVCNTDAGVPAGGVLPTITVTVSVSASACCGAQVTLSATVDNPSDGTPDNNTASITSPVGRAAGVDLTVSTADSGAPFAAGGTGAYTVVVHNAGTAASSDTVTVTVAVAGDPVTSLLTLSGTDWDCSPASQVCTTSASASAGGSLPPITAAVSLSASAACCGAQANLTVTVDNPSDTTLDNNTASITTPVVAGAVDLTVNIAESDTSFVEGGTGGYTLMVRNAGSAVSNDVVSVTYPAPFTDWSASGSGWSCSTSPAVCTTASPVDPGTSLPVIAVTGPVPSSGAPEQISVSATVDNPSDTDTANNTVSMTTPITRSATIDLVAGVADGGAPGVSGGTATFTVTVRNAGTETSSGVTNVDLSLSGDPIAGLEEASGPDWECSVASLLCTTSSSVPADSSLPPITAIVGVAPDSGCCAAVAGLTVSVDNPSETNPTNNTTSITTPIVAGPVDLTVNVADGGSPFVAGGTGAYTLVVHNSGTAASSGVITVAYPQLFADWSASGSDWSCSTSPAVCTTATPVDPGASLPVITATGPVPVQDPPAQIVANASLDNASDTNTANNAASITTNIVPGPVDRPNVVVVMTDDQAYEQLRVMANTQALIGAEGVTFDNFVVSLALCCPSRATFMTGQYAFHHGVVANGGAFGGYQALDTETALPVWLQQAGYRTIHLGKFLNGYGQGAPTEIPPGWDDWQAFLDNSYFDYRLNDNGTVVDYGAAPEDYSTDVVGARAVEAIAESAPGGPFFLNLAVYGPHVEQSSTFATAVPAPRHDGAFATEPLPRPPSFNEADLSDKPAHIQELPLMQRGDLNDVQARYRDRLESLLSVDEVVADVVEALEVAGELDNTVIVFTSDNGYFHGEHRLEKGKVQPYEEAIRVPLLVRGPGFPAGTEVSAPTSNIDLAPTIAAIAGATPLVAVDGIDLRSVVQDPASFATRSTIIELYEDHCFLGVRTASETYVRYDTGEEELYDLTVDPYQLTSVHADPAYSARRDELAAQLAAAVPDPPPCGPFTDINIGDVTVSEPRSGRPATVRFPVTLSSRLFESLDVAYRIEAGTAGSADVVLTTGTLTLRPKQLASYVEVTVRQDALEEPAENVTVTLEPPASLPFGVTFTRPTGVLTILDRPASAGATAAVGDLVLFENRQRQYLPVTLSGAAATDIVIGFAAADGTAQGSDYAAKAGTVTVRAGQTSALIPLQILADRDDEPDEIFTVTITPPPEILVERETGTVTIIDDDVE